MIVAYTTACEALCSRSGSALAAQIIQYFITAVKHKWCYTHKGVMAGCSSPFLMPLSTQIALSNKTKLKKIKKCECLHLHSIMYVALLLLQPFNASFPGLPGWAGTRKVKAIWILLVLETKSGSGISWAIRKSAPRSRQITMPVPHHSVFYRPDARPATQPTVSKHWRHRHIHCINEVLLQTWFTITRLSVWQSCILLQGNKVTYNNI